jgi:hypothetical protein
VRAAARKLELPKSTVSDIKVQKLGIKGRVKQKAPKYKNGQKERARAACGTILRKAHGHIVIMDDETYVPVDPADVPGRQFYHARDPNSVPDEHRFKAKQKFPKQYLVWQCMDSEGHVSRPYIQTGTMDANTYKSECLVKRLLPFINQYHKGRRVLFWPDMAKIHYAKIVKEWLTEQKIPFVTWEENAPNVPQARPIERFWALCKKEYSQRQDAPATEHAFTCIWSRLSKEVATRSSKKLMQNVRPALRQINEVGVYEPLKN